MRCGPTRMAGISVCFLVNPIAGIGGRLGLKGSDNIDVKLLAGKEAPAPERASRFVRALARLIPSEKVFFLTVNNKMGEGYIEETVYKSSYRVIYRYSSWPTSRNDTIKAVKACVKNDAKIIVFVGGDGTARDVYKALEASGSTGKPILGVPSGVKVYSSVFAISPEAAANTLASYITGNAATCTGEILDIDEEAYRRGKLKVKLYAIAKIPCSNLMVASSKEPTPQTPTEEENRKAIATHIKEYYMRDCTLYVLGPGTTTKAIADAIGVEKTLLGVDVIHNGKLLVRDANEEALYRAVKRHRERGGRVLIIVSPLGGQGFLLGRGNQQISPRVLREAGGRKSLLAVATRSKMAKLKQFLVDTGDPELDAQLEGYIRVVVDYGEEAIIPLRAATRTEEEQSR
ncbi:MAG: ATP-NAD kinase [Hyperthermus sp.]|nr:MAG: ATP-NAD kinase [Hyperthermus sp.]